MGARMLEYACGRRFSQPTNRNNYWNPDLADGHAPDLLHAFCVLARNARTVTPGVRMLDTPVDAVAHSQATVTIFGPGSR